MDINLIYGLIGGGIAVGGVITLERRLKRQRLIRKGRKAERIVGKALKKLRSRDNIVINNVILGAPGGYTSQIDHILVSRRGIFVIETKSHAGRITGSEHGQYWQQHLSDTTKTFYNPLLQNRSHVKSLQRLFPDVEDVFVSVIVFTGAWRIEIKADDIIKPRRFFPDRHIRRTFVPSERRKRKWWNPGKEVRLDETNIVTPFEDLLPDIGRRKKVLSRREIRDIAEKIRNADLNTRGTAREHTSYAKSTARRVDNGIRHGVCPRCGGRLVVKKGDRGEFVGCENYPDCRFTCSVDRLH